MFARLSAALLLALPLLAAASNCATEKQQCCQSVHQADSESATKLLSTVGIVIQGVVGQIGATCSPLSLVAASGTSCSQQTVCCENNNFNGIVALGCTPLNFNL